MILVDSSLGEEIRLAFLTAVDILSQRMFIFCPLFLEYSSLKYFSPDNLAKVVF